MKKIIFVIIFVLTILFALFVSGVIVKKTAAEPKSTVLPFVDTKVIDYSPNPILFNPAVSSFKKDSAKVVSGNKGGILPHHDVASPMIAEFFQSLPEAKTIIIVGTNHTDAGNGLAITGNITYKTPLGNIETDTKIMGELVRTGLANFDNERLTTEHSIFVEVPFVKYYFPEAKVVPIILSSKHDIKKSIRLAEVLAKYVREDSVLILGSTDFSHYLPTDITRQKDEETREMILSRNYEAVARFNNDHVDSPPTLITLLKTMENLATKTKILNYSELAEMTGKTSVQSSTSYFTIIFNK